MLQKFRKKWLKPTHVQLIISNSRHHKFQSPHRIMSIKPLKRKRYINREIFPRLWPGVKSFRNCWEFEYMISLFFISKVKPITLRDNKQYCFHEGLNRNLWTGSKLLEQKYCFFDHASRVLTVRKIQDMICMLIHSGNQFCSFCNYQLKVFHQEHNQNLMH